MGQESGHKFARLLKVGRFLVVLNLLLSSIANSRVSWDNVSSISFVLWIYPILTCPLLASLSSVEILEPTHDVLGIDIFEALFNKTINVSLKVMISLEFVDLDDNKSPFKCSKCSKVFYLPSAIMKGEKFFL
jgi:hypothetical protein